MELTQASLETTLASRYITLLCKHWSHRFRVDFDERRGYIDFGGSSCELRANVTLLHIKVAASGAELDELEAVVAEHLQRLLPRDQKLHLAWSRAAAACP